MTSNPTDLPSRHGRVHFVDDNRDLREVVARVLPSAGLEVFTYESVDEFFSKFEPTCPAVAVVDMRMPMATGLDLLVRARNAGITCPIVFMSGEATAPEAVEALKRGASDFLFKPVPLTTLREIAFRAMETHLADERERSGLDSFTRRYRSLTPRERQLCRHIANDESIKEISTRFGISEPTVKIHKARVLKKMAASTSVALALELTRYEAKLTVAIAEEDRN